MAPRWFTLALCKGERAEGEKKRRIGEKSGRERTTKLVAEVG